MESKVSLLSLIISGTVSATLGYQTLIIDQIEKNPERLKENMTVSRQEVYPPHIKDSLVFHLHDSTRYHDSIILKLVTKSKNAIFFDTVIPRIDSTKVVLQYAKNHHMFQIGVAPYKPKLDDSSGN